MSFQKNDESDFDFSIIDKKAPQQAKLNFSVESLLSQHQHECKIQPNPPLYQQYEAQEYNNAKQIPQLKGQVINGSFLNDLQKLQEELSFQSQLYNVYQQETESNDSENHTKSYFNAKSNSHLKTTKQQTNDIMKSQSIDDYGYLVLDFTKRKKTKLNPIQKTNKTKCITQNSKLKNSRSSYTLIEEMQKNSNSKSKYQKSLNKLFSPKQKQISTVKIKIKSPVVSKGKVKNHSKSKTPSKQMKFNNTKNTTISTAIAQSFNKTNKSTKSLRQANAYSQYYGVEDLRISQRLITKSNCLGSAGNSKLMDPQPSRSPKNKTIYSFNSSNSKTKNKKSVHSRSPSNKDVTLRFKKKKK